MSSAMNALYEDVLLEATVGTLAPRIAEPPVHPARKRRTAAKKAAPAVSHPAMVERATEESSPVERVHSDVNVNLLAAYQQVVAVVRQAWQWLQARRQWQLTTKRLALCETVSLGDKRFLAIVKVDGQQFLVGGAAGSVSMLAEINGQGEFASLLQQRRRTGRAAR
jgi:flagellar biogenesis protein FliO